MILTTHDLSVPCIVAKLAPLNLPPKQYRSYQYDDQSSSSQYLSTKATYITLLDVRRDNERAAEALLDGDISESSRIRSRAFEIIVAARNREKERK